MNAANPLPAAGAPALQSLLNALMNAVVEAVRIDDLTEFDLLLQQTPIDGVEDLAGWLSRNDVAAHRFRRSITTLTVNRAAVELFGAESINQLVEHMNATQYSVSSPNLIGFMTAIRIGATSFSGTFLLPRSARPVDSRCHGNTVCARRKSSFGLSHDSADRHPPQETKPAAKRAEQSSGANSAAAAVSKQMS